MKYLKQPSKTKELNKLFNCYYNTQIHKLSMKQLFYILSISAILILNACSGQKKVAENSQDLSKPAAKKNPSEILVEKDVDLNLENSLLWKITGNGLEEESYLYGTIHIIDAESFFWPANTMESFNKSDKVVFEIDLDEMSDMGNIMGMMSKVMMKDGMTLKKLLSDEDYAIVNDHFKDLGLPMFMLEKMKPMFLTIFADGDMDFASMQDPSQSTTKSYEMEFYELANNTEKEVFGLETMDDQISLFDKIPYEDQAQMLVEGIKASSETPEGEESELEMITRMYLEQDITSMVSSIEDEDSDLAGFEDLLLNDRNQKWIPLMSSYMKESPTFFAVGAGHLAGQEGVINLLRSVGYILTPISAEEK